MKKIIFSCFFLVLFLVPAMADPFVGTFSGEMDGERYELSLKKSEDNKYTGVMSVEGYQIQLLGVREDKQLYGQFLEEGDVYEFVATAKENGALFFEDEDGESILFVKIGAKAASNIENTSGKESNGADKPSSVRNVFVNGVKLDQNTLSMIESNYQIPLADGRYWYDTHCGAWGVEGGPTAGFILPGMPFPGPMPYAISGGGTGIVINGREIHPLDQQALYQLFGVTYQGQFWMDAQGNIGYVGGPPIANILQAAQAKGSAGGGGGGSVTHGYDSTYGARGTSAGGMYSGRTATGKSVFWYPGM